MFSTTHNKPLELENGWRNHGDSFAAATYSCVDGLVTLQGLIKDGNFKGIFATLPVGVDRAR